jgi:hypothetical protein
MSGRGGEEGEVVGETGRKLVGKIEHLVGSFDL